MSIVKAYVSKDCLFLLLWIIIRGRMLLLVTANKVLLSVRGLRTQGSGRKWLRLGLILIVGPLAPTSFFP
jgi:hypothetical protein